MWQRPYARRKACKLQEQYHKSKAMADTGLSLPEDHTAKMEFLHTPRDLGCRLQALQLESNDFGASGLLVCILQTLHPKPYTPNPITPIIPISSISPKPGWRADCGAQGSELRVRQPRGSLRLNYPCVCTRLYITSISTYVYVYIYIDLCVCKYIYM